MLNIQRAIARYGEMTDIEQVQVREMVFEHLSATDDQIAQLIDRAIQAYTNEIVNRIEPFVSNNAADFGTDGQTALLDIRERIRNRFADGANSVPGVSGAVAVRTP